jgi:hypothetical protein
MSASSSTRSLKIVAYTREQIQSLAPVRVWPFERRQSAGDRADYGEAVFRQVKPCASGNRPDNNHQRNRKPRREPAAEEDARHDEDRQGCRLRAKRRRPAHDLPELPKRVVRNDVDAKHATEHRDADLNPDAGQKPD